MHLCIRRKYKSFDFFVECSKFEQFVDDTGEDFAGMIIVAAQAKMLLFDGGVAMESSAHVAFRVTT